MNVIKALKTQYNYAFNYKAYSKNAFFNKLFLFPFTYFLRLRPSPPMAIQLLLTFRCNLACRMCSFKSLINRVPRELTTRQITEFIGNNLRFKPSIFLSGGEPFLRPDIIEIVQFVKSRRLNCGICTNALLLDEAKIDALIQSGLDYIIFSLHGPKPVHNAIVGDDTAFDRVVRTIERYVQRKTKNNKVMINCAISAQNARHLQEVLRIADELQVDLAVFQHLSFITPSEQARQKESDCFPEHRVIGHFGNALGYEEICSEVRKLRIAAQGYKVNTIFKPDLNDQEIRGWYSGNYTICRDCFLLWGAVYVYPDGGIYACQYIEKSFGNILRDNLSDVWTGKEYNAFRNRIRKGLLPFCARCCKL